MNARPDTLRYEILGNWRRLDGLFPVVVRSTRCRAIRDFCDRTGVIHQVRSDANDNEYSRLDAAHSPDTITDSGVRSFLLDNRDQHRGNRRSFRLRIQCSKTGEIVVCSSEWMPKGLRMRAATVACRLHLSIRYRHALPDARATSSVLDLFVAVLLNVSGIDSPSLFETGMSAQTTSG